MSRHPSLDVRRQSRRIRRTISGEQRVAATDGMSSLAAAFNGLMDAFVEAAAQIARAITAFAPLERGPLAESARTDDPATADARWRDLYGGPDAGQG